MDPLSRNPSPPVPEFPEPPAPTAGPLPGWPKLTLLAKPPFTHIARIFDIPPPLLTWDQIPLTFQPEILSPDDGPPPQGSASQSRA